MFTSLAIRFIVTNVIARVYFSEAISLVGGDCFAAKNDGSQRCSFIW